MTVLDGPTPRRSPYSDLIGDTAPAQSTANGATKPRSQSSPYASLIDDDGGFSGHGSSSTWGDESVTKRAGRSVIDAASDVGQSLKALVTHPQEIILDPLRHIGTAAVAPGVGEARHDPRLSKGGNPSAAPIDAPAYDAEHGGVANDERTLAGVQAVTDIAAAGAIPGASKPMQAALLAATGAQHTPDEPLKGAATALAAGALVHGAIKGGGKVAGAIGAGDEAARTAGREDARAVLAKAYSELPEKVQRYVDRDPILGPVTHGAHADSIHPAYAALLASESAPASAGHDERDVRATKASTPAPEPPSGAVDPVLESDPGERNLGLGLPARVKRALGTAYRSALVTPYAEIERDAPDLTNELLNAGAAKKRAEHIATRRLGHVFEGLSDEQKQHFGTKLVYDNLVAEAERKAAAANALPESEAGGAASAEPAKSSRGLWYSPTTSAGTLRSIDEMETEPLLQELARRSKASVKYFKDTRRYGPTSAVTLRNEEKIGAIEDLLTDRDGLDRDAVWNEVKRRNDAAAASRDAEDATDFNFGENVKTTEPAKPAGPAALAFERYAPEPTAAEPSERQQLLDASARFRAHAERLAPRIPAGLEAEPWFQQSLAAYKEHIAEPLTKDALSAGVDPASLRRPKSAYVRLASEQRLDDAEIRRALDVAGVTDPADLQRRPALLRKLIGENPALKHYFARNAEGPRVGPLAKDAGYPGEPAPTRGKTVAVSGSSKMAQGTAQDYTTDLSRVIDFDARDKAIKAARNRAYTAVANLGRQLEPGEAPAPGKRVVSFTDQKGLTTGDTGTLRYEVTPEVANAVTKFFKQMEAEPTSAGFRTLKTVSDVATRAQISGIPVEATSHMNSLASIVASVPGEKDVTGSALTAVPGLGARLAAIREMKTINFKDPAIRKLENRLADIGALRIEESHGGLVNWAHRWLFDPEGIDARGRLVLARKLLAAKPDATDFELRRFITSKLGNYISENAGAWPNFAAKGSVVAPFARFQSARIPTAVKTVLGQSGLPSKTVGERARNIGGTLWRGTPGYILGIELANKAATGHFTNENEAGHELDIDTGWYAIPGGIARLSPSQVQEYGDKAAKLHIPAGVLNPLLYAGWRAMGGKAALTRLAHIGDKNAPDHPGTLADAERDAVNVGLGTLGPLVRAGGVAITGRQPYLQRDGNFMRVVDTKIDPDKEAIERIKMALLSANPAIHAFAEGSGDAPRSLADVLAEDGKPFGGAASVAARVAEFTIPRVLTPSIGGRTNEQSVLAQDDRRYAEALSDAKRRYRDAPGPIARKRIADETAREFAARGYDPDAVRLAIEKVETQDRQAIRDRQNDQVQRRVNKRRR